MTTDYPLGTSLSECARLLSQSDQLRPQAEALLEQVGLRRGQRVLDLGCGPRGILELLSAAVGPTGRVVGVDADPTLVALAAQRGLDNVEVHVGDATGTGLLGDSFDLVHARTLLAYLQEPAKAVAEMVRLAKPGGWVAGLEVDAECSALHPALPAWDRLRELFQATFAAMDADLRIGRRLPELYREAGLEDVQFTVHASAYPADHGRRTILPDIVRSLRPKTVQFGLATEPELDSLDHAVRAHLADPHTFVVPELIVIAWARKPF